MCAEVRSDAVKPPCTCPFSRPRFVWSVRVIRHADIQPVQSAGNKPRCAAVLTRQNWHSQQPRLHRNAAGLHAYSEEVCGHSESDRCATPCCGKPSFRQNQSHVYFFFWKEFDLLRLTFHRIRWQPLLLSCRGSGFEAPSAVTCSAVGRRAPGRKPVSGVCCGGIWAGLN